MHINTFLAASHDAVDRMIGRLGFEFYVSETMSQQQTTIQETFQNFISFDINSEFRDTPPIINNVFLKTNSMKTHDVSKIYRIILAFKEGDPPHVLIKSGDHLPLLQYKQLKEIKHYVKLGMETNTLPNVEWSSFLQEIQTKYTYAPIVEIKDFILSTRVPAKQEIDAVTLQDNKATFVLIRRRSAFETHTFTLTFEA